MITHNNLISNAAMLSGLGLQRRRCAVACITIIPCAWFFVALNLALIHGGSVVLLPKFDLDAVLSVLPDVTVMMVFLPTTLGY